MLKFKNKIFKMLFVLVLFSMVIFSNSVYANTMTLDLNGIGDNKEDIANRNLNIWKISDKVYTDEEKQKLVKDLENKSIDSLKVYSKTSFKTDEDGKLIHDFSEGTYYVRVVFKEGAKNIYPFAFVVDEIHDGGIIYPKGHGDTPPGNVELLKLSKDRKALPGAVFRLYKIVDGKEIPIESSMNFYDFVTDSQGKIYVNNLEPGEYMFKEIEPPVGYKIKKEKTYFYVSSSKTTYVEVYNYKDDEGGKRFKKISSDTGEGLAGAEFVVTRKNDLYYERIKVDGKDLVLFSGRDGFFNVENLPYGEYYLWETKPPVGYEELSDNVKFVIDDLSYEKDLYIKNKPAQKKSIHPPTPTPDQPSPQDKTPVKIPKTGDITLIVMVVAGFISFILGIKMVKEKE